MPKKPHTALLAVSLLLLLCCSVVACYSAAALLLLTARRIEHKLELCQSNQGKDMIERGQDVKGWMSTLLMFLYILLMQLGPTTPLNLEVDDKGDKDNRTDHYQRSLLVSPSNRRFQREAMQAWSKSLTEKDYDNEHWPKLLGLYSHFYVPSSVVLHKFLIFISSLRPFLRRETGERSGPPQYFDYYIVQLSKIFAKYNAQVNFVSVG